MSIGSPSLTRARTAAVVWLSSRTGTSDTHRSYYMPVVLSAPPGGPHAGPDTGSATSAVAQGQAHPHEHRPPGQHARDHPDRGGPGAGEPGNGARRPQGGDDGAEPGEQREAPDVGEAE